MTRPPRDPAVAVILAAGEGKRMRSDRAKVLHPMLGRPMVDWVLAACEEAGLARAVVVVGSKREQVIAWLSDRTRSEHGIDVRWAVQEEQKGTGHALQVALPEVDAGGPPREIVVLCGDAPLLRAETVRSLLRDHRERGAAATILTADVPDPTGYGRIVRTEDGDVERIVEHKDASDAERAIPEINSADYVFDLADVRSALAEVKNDNRQGEFYLTDTIAILRGRGRPVIASKVADAREVLGVNSPEQLAEAEAAWTGLHGRTR
jgi:bifunctional UDP-N-acetylglucosamine pyrophosphorylase/glucosamine-1-phosphate N-acetyltransferase